jgi:hypothetical protein
LKKSYEKSDNTNDNVKRDRRVNIENFPVIQPERVIQVHVFMLIFDL